MRGKVRLGIIWMAGFGAAAAAASLLPKEAWSQGFRELEKFRGGHRPARLTSVLSHWQKQTAAEQAGFFHVNV